MGTSPNDLSVKFSGCIVAQCVGVGSEDLFIILLLCRNAICYCMYCFVFSIVGCECVITVKSHHFQVVAGFGSRSYVGKAF